MSSDIRSEAELLAEAPRLRAQMIQEWSGGRRKRPVMHEGPQPYVPTADSAGARRVLAAADMIGDAVRWLGRVFVGGGAEVAAARAEPTRGSPDDARLAAMADARARVLARDRESIEEAVRHRWVA